MAEVFSGCVDGQTVNRRPQVELAPSGVAAKAVVAMTAEMNGKGSAARSGCAMDRTRAAQAGAKAGRGGEAQQVQDLLDADLRADLLEVDPRHDSSEMVGSGEVGALASTEKRPG
jgi:hypothetical protein